MNKNEFYGGILKIFMIFNAIIMAVVQLFSAAIIAQFIYYCVNDIYYYTDETVSLFLILMGVQTWRALTMEACKLLVEFSEM